MCFKETESTEGRCDHADYEEGHDSGEGGNDPVEKLSTEEGRGDSEGEEDEGNEVRVVVKVLDETLNFEGGATNWMGCFNNEVALVV